MRTADGVVPVQSPLPRQPLGDRTARPPVDDDAPLSAELAAVVSGARRRAVRDDDRQIDTAHLLHSLLEQDPEARTVLDDGPEIVRLLGYLVQRSIGYGLRWRGLVERPGTADPAAGPGRPHPRPGSGAEAPTVDSDGLSPLAALAMDRARVLARDHGPARGLHLFAALVADPGARSAEVLERAGLDRHDVLARIEKQLAREGAAAWWETTD
ncbi:peptidase [Streptomyces sp. SID4950]|nr:Clp protease N-terminal domain-containing protein [Streptomyces sp. SID4950]MYQ67306.1 peptidase [Streptomyces sp. SID4950]